MKMNFSFRLRNVIEMLTLSAASCKTMFILLPSEMWKEVQDMLYQSLKLTNGIWILAELRIQLGNTDYTLLLKCRAPEVSRYLYQVYNSILKN